MRLSYQLARINYCHEPADPDAASLMLGALGVGKVTGARGFWSAAIVSGDAGARGLLPAASALANQMPAMLRRLVDATTQGLAFDAPPGLVVGSVRGSMKGPIYVSSVDAPREIDVTDARGLAVLELEAIAPRRAENEVRRELLWRARAEWRPGQSHARLLELAPEQLAWQPPSPSRPR
jgi:hypothetical protein